MKNRGNKNGWVVARRIFRPDEELKKNMMHLQKLCRRKAQGLRINTLKISVVITEIKSFSSGKNPVGGRRILLYLCWLENILIMNPDYSIQEPSAMAAAVLLTSPEKGFWISGGRKLAILRHGFKERSADTMKFKFPGQRFYRTLERMGIRNCIVTNKSLKDCPDIFKIIFIGF